LLALDGAADQFFGVWEDDQSEIRGARVADDGTVLDPEGVLIGTMGESAK
jgi:hypothetical protein